jgi:hypothetical protein
VLLYHVPWYSPIQLFNIFKVNADVLNFSILSFILGTVLMLAIMTVWSLLFAFILRTDKVWRIMVGAIIYGMAVWSVMQYLILPHISSLVIARAFPPSGFLLIFMLYGLLLGYYFSEKQIKAML